MGELVDPNQGRGGLGVDSHHPIAPSDEIDLARFRGERLARGPLLGGDHVGAPHRLEHEVDVIGVLRQVGPAALGFQAIHQRRADVDRGGHGLEIGPVSAGDVDPQQPPVGQP
jgi:hypothetical protein